MTIGGGAAKDLGHAERALRRLSLKCEPQQTEFAARGDVRSGRRGIPRLEQKSTAFAVLRSVFGDRFR